MHLTGLLGATLLATYDFRKHETATPKLTTTLIIPALLVHMVSAVFAANRVVHYDVQAMSVHSACDSMHRSLVGRRLRLRRRRYEAKTEPDPGAS